MSEKSSSPTEYQEPEVLRNADDWSDETFFKHMDKRHWADIGKEKAGRLQDYRGWQPDTIALYRTYHDTLHRLAHPGKYDHEHALF